MFLDNPRALLLMPISSYLFLVLQDLSVRQEGLYTLRFRFFDLSAAETIGAMPAPALTECQSQTFRVYSPRQYVLLSSRDMITYTFSLNGEFIIDPRSTIRVPALPKPTELAEHFAQQGFKLNTRKVSCFC